MTISAVRKLVLAPAQWARSSLVPLRALWWPTAEPDDVLDYSLDWSAILADAGDTIASAAVSVAPSGAGELTASSLAVVGGVMTVWLTGGVPGRAYTVRAEIATVNGRTIERLIGLRINAALATWPFPLPPSLGFGTPVTWGAGAPANALLGADGLYLLGADGAFLTWS